jgi:hypothetical protein
MNARAAEHRAEGSHQATGKKGPITVRSLAADLRETGRAPGMVLLATAP